jgi:CheY-like chemotaxis protein
MVQRVIEDGPDIAEQSGLTVLIADDDPGVTKLVTFLISTAGHRVIAATDGKEAIGLWESERPQVILMDLQMPILDGFDATRRIRARERETGGQVPIYGLTGHSQNDVGTLCLEAGMTGHMAKPINLQHLRDTIARHQSSI